LTRLYSKKEKKERGNVTSVPNDEKKNKEKDDDLDNFFCENNNN